MPLGGGFVAPVGFEKPPGGEIGSAHHVLNDHTYCCAMTTGNCEEEEPMTSPEKANNCLLYHKAKIGTRASDAKRLGIPLFITEFGACFTEGPCTQEINQVGDVCDEHLAGWAYWEFKTYEDLTTSAGTNSEGFYDKDGNLQDFKVKALARSYMQRTQGTPTSMNFDTTTGDFLFEFNLDTRITSPSIGYFSKEYWYENGITYQFSDENGTELPATSLTADY